MNLFAIIAGAFAGLAIASSGDKLTAMAFGALIGYLLVQNRALGKRFRELQQRVNSGTSQATTPAPGSLAAAPRAATAMPHPKPTVASARGEPAPARPFISTHRPALIDKWILAARTWLTTGNVPVKLGVIVSFFGVAFLLRYAVDQQLLTIPIEARYAGIMIGAIAMLIVGWRLRHSSRVYALSLQGGALGIMYLLIFAALRLHGLLPATPAFALLIVLTAATGLLAVRQNAQPLAILGTVGGFLAPVLVSTGTGNHIALFSYYLLLNCAILGIAWYRAWRVLNIIGFLFTFGIGTLWGHQYYRPALFASTEPFLALHFVFYTAIAVLFAHRQPPQLRGLVDATLVFGTPSVAFALQSLLVENSEYTLAISAAVAAVFYASLAWWLSRQDRSAFDALERSFFVLAVAFATIAVPLALDDRLTASIWALEGAAVVWAGVRQNRWFPKAAGSALAFLSGVAFVEEGWVQDQGWLLLNANFIGGMTIAAASVYIAWSLWRDANRVSLQGAASIALLVWGAVWWLATGSLEIADRFSTNAFALHLVNAFYAMTAALLAWLACRCDWPAARRASLAYLALLPLVALAYLIEYGHPLAGAGVPAWLGGLAAHATVLWYYGDNDPRLAGIWHFSGALFFTVLLAFDFGWRVDHATWAENWADTWAVSMMLATVLFCAFSINALRARVSWPFGRHAAVYLAAAATMTVWVLLSLLVDGIDDPAATTPIVYLPIANPFDVLTLCASGLALLLLRQASGVTDWFTADRCRAAMMAWFAAAFLLTTIAVVRAVYHLDGLAWNGTALFNATTVQAALSMYWAIVGLGGMILGARSGRREVWIIGAGLMVLVVVKLFVIDLGNTGTVARIISFLGVGGMLLTVGYFAPAPPRKIPGAGEALS